MWLTLTKVLILIISWNFTSAKYLRAPEVMLLPAPVDVKQPHIQENQEFQWPMGIIPYYFDTTSYDSIVEFSLRMVMNKLEEVSCVRFQSLVVKPTRNIHYIFITNPNKERECVHEPRHIAGEENAVILALGLDCLSLKEILHSLMHAIGFKDEVTHPMRDQFIRISWENIQPQYRPLFRVQVDDFSSMNLVEYDPLSIMHFHDRAFTRNGHATITPVLPGLLISPSENLSQLDKMKLRLMFGHECNKRKVDDILDSCKLAFKTDSGFSTNKTVGNNDNRESLNKVKNNEQQEDILDKNAGNTNGMVDAEEQDKEKVNVEEGNGNKDEAGIQGESIENEDDRINNNEQDSDEKLR